MSVPRFHPLRIADIRRETADCVSLAFEVPEPLRAAYAFVPGQYLTLSAVIGGEEVRRSYSICSGLDDGELRVAVKRLPGGVFSGWANGTLRAGDTLGYGHAASFRYDQLGRLASISLPTLILTNSGDLTFPLAKRAAASRPDFDYVELAGGTHDIVDEQPEAFSAAVATFIGRQVAAGRRT